MSRNNPQRISLFTSRLIWIVLLVFSLLGILFWRIGLVTNNEMMEYTRLVADAESSQSSAKLEPYTAHQERQGIQKDLFFQKGPHRLQVRLTAAKAQLILDHQEAHTYVIEHMQKVKCLMQEELYYILPDGREAWLHPSGRLLLRSTNEKEPTSWLPADIPGLQPMQIIRCMEAENAEYRYKDDSFVGHSVKIIRFSSPGHDLKDDNIQPTRPLMKGDAEQVEFTLKGKDNDLNFKASGLKTTFFDPGEMHL